MDWESIYQSRVTTADEAIRSVRSGDRLFLTGNCSVPRRILDALVRYAPEVDDVEICQALTVGGSEYVAPELAGHLRVNSLFISKNVREAIQQGRGDFTPVLLSEFPLLFKKKVLPVDVALVHLSPPDAEGYCTYGVESGLTITAAESAKRIIAEINPNMPSMHGDTAVHVSQLDQIIPVDYPLAELSMSVDGSIECVEQIAIHVAGLIPDGACLQVGIGAIPNAILKYLDDKRDLGIHSELFSDGVIDLVERGVINGARKGIHPGKITSGFMIGTHRLYHWAHDNPRIELQRTEYVNNPFTIAQNPRTVAINSAVEVDLTGQVCADSIGPKFYSGVGGQLDFIYGAGLSEGGFPIIALPSCTNLQDGSCV
ncbi:MAG: acetyl-CoA hydrolase/transferase family protein, partial [Chloroflexi bacterium]|nr:acetyl-CoA hydrolase/transferase family protein [Chloroflexota bacterium]